MSFRCAVIVFPYREHMTGPRHRFLLISRVGAQSTHQHWLQPAANRSFDVLLSSYDETVADPCLPGVKFEFRAGKKVAGYGQLFETHARYIAQYDYVALFDDDLLIDSSSLTALFNIVAALNVKIAQPALTHDSHFTYAALLQDRNYSWRHVNYIEMMCPIFRQDVLQAVLPLFDMGFESGIDLIWCNLVAQVPADEFAVIDSVPVRHARAVGQLKSQNGFVAGKRYEDDIYGILDQFDIPWLSCVPYSGRRVDGRTTQSRIGFLLSALVLVGVIGRQKGWRLRGRSVLVYWKHLMTRRPKNIRTTLLPRRPDNRLQ